MTTGEEHTVHCNKSIIGQRLCHFIIEATIKFSRINVFHAQHPIETGNITVCTYQQWLRPRQTCNGSMRRVRVR